MQPASIRRRRCTLPWLCVALCWGIHMHITEPFSGRESGLFTAAFSFRQDSDLGPLEIPLPPTHVRSATNGSRASLYCLWNLHTHKARFRCGAIQRWFNEPNECTCGSLKREAKSWQFRWEEVSLSAGDVIGLVPFRAFSRPDTEEKSVDGESMNIIDENVRVRHLSYVCVPSVSWIRPSTTCVRLVIVRHFPSPGGPVLMHILFTHQWQLQYERLLSFEWKIHYSYYYYICH